MVQQVTWEIEANSLMSFYEANEASFVRLTWGDIAY
jgi:hypothetical protein